MAFDFFTQKQRLFDLWAPSYDWLFPSVFYQAIHQRLLDYVVVPERANVLDLGCGTGRLLNRLAEQFPQLRGIGFDLSEEMLRQARDRNRHRPRLLYFQGNAEALPFEDQQFDAVFSTISFLHYPHPDTVLAEVSRVLKPGGHFYWVDPVFGSHPTSQLLAVSPGGIRLYPPASRAQMGQSVGLDDAEHHYLLWPVMLTHFRKDSSHPAP